MTDSEQKIVELEKQGIVDLGLVDGFRVVRSTDEYGVTFRAFEPDHDWLNNFREIVRVEYRDGEISWPSSSSNDHRPSVANVFATMLKMAVTHTPRLGR